MITSFSIKVNLYTIINTETPDRAIALLKVKSIYNRIKSETKRHIADLSIYSRAPLWRARRPGRNEPSADVDQQKSRDATIEEEKEEEQAE